MRNNRTMNIALATACMKTGKSYTNVARRAGISRETLSKLVNGVGVPRLHTIQRLADGLGVSVTELGFFTQAHQNTPTNFKTGKEAQP